MHNLPQIIGTSISQAFQELRANKLRTTLSLLGITIGIFCIIAVLTTLDSMKNNIQTQMASLGSDVIYIDRWPWTDDGGDYKWWDYQRRPSMTPREAKTILQQVPDVAYSTLCLGVDGVTVRYADLDVGNITSYGVLADYDKVQNIEIAKGRYLSNNELDGGSNVVVLGSEVYNILFPTHNDPLGKQVTLLNKKFTVVGVMKKTGENMTGFDYDNSTIIPYYAIASIVDVHSTNYDPLLAVKAVSGRNPDEVRYEVEGVLRRLRKVRPGQGNDFAINQLSEISNKIDSLFDVIDIIALIIGGFSLLVGSFGIANIMFVTVKERTKIIGLKKAIGAHKASILLEFLLEAIVLCIIGGLIGIVLVYILSLVVTYGFDFEIVLSTKNFFIGIFVSIFVGVLSGFIPARSAARLDPVVAIRTN